LLFRIDCDKIHHSPPNTSIGEEAMRPTKRLETWVVYRTVLRGQESPINAVCEQGEWDAMEATRPGQHVLIRAGIKSEGEAERLARGTSGDPIPRTARASNASTARPLVPIEPDDDEPAAPPSLSN